MGSTSLSSLSAAERLLGCCLRGQPCPPDLLDTVIGPEHSQEFFTVVVESLADLFEPRLCDAYADLFAALIPKVLAHWSEAELRSRYERVRRVRPFSGPDPHDVFVLSRVTLGADIAIASMALDAAKKRFPAARIHFVGSRKNWEMFGGDSRILHCDIPYQRSLGVAERLQSGLTLAGKLKQYGGIVLDPDSRLTQLGILPVCPDERYFFFESRSAGGESSASLGALTAKWLEEVLGTGGARAFIFPIPEANQTAYVSVSLGVGGNDRKKIPEPFERKLIAGLSHRRWDVIVDKGSGREEAERVERAVNGLPRVRTFEGSFAQFANIIGRSRLYIGYDSAGQHAAAACGVPLISVFAGAISDRFVSRWTPVGSGPVEAVRVLRPEPDEVLEAVLAAIARIEERL